MRVLALAKGHSNEFSIGKNMRKIFTDSRFSTAAPIHSRTIGLGVALLSGVLIIAYGFFHDISEVMDLGVVITGTISWVILTLAITSGRSGHHTGRLR